MPDELFKMMTGINDVHRAGILAGAELERSKIQQLEAENRKLKEHIRHLEDSLAVALGEKMGLDPETEQRERESEQAQVMADHRRELGEDR